MVQVRQGLFNPRRGLVARRPAGKLGEPCSARASGGIEVADDHMVEQDVVQPASRELPADQVGVHIENRNLGQRPFEFKTHRPISALGCRITVPCRTRCWVYSTPAGGRSEEGGHFTFCMGGCQVGRDVCVIFDFRFCDSGFWIVLAQRLL